MPVLGITVLHGVFEHSPICSMILQLERRLLRIWLSTFRTSRFAKIVIKNVSLDRYTAFLPMSLMAMLRYSIAMIFSSRGFEEFRCDSSTINIVARKGFLTGYEYHRYFIVPHDSIVSESRDGICHIFVSNPCYFSFPPILVGHVPF